MATQASHVTWLPEVAKPEDISKSSVSTDCLHPRGSQASSWPGAAAQTTDTNMASGDIMDHGGPSRRSNPETELFLISGLPRCIEPA